MASTRVATQVDWNKIYTGLGLAKGESLRAWLQSPTVRHRSPTFPAPTTETLHELSTFRARHSAALTRAAALNASLPEIDLSHYKTVLKDQRAVHEAEKALSAFKPVGYEVDKWNGVVEAFEGKAVRRLHALLFPEVYHG
jgi:F-type H+-transporting ATPase subunit d